MTISFNQHLGAYVPDPEPWAEIRDGRVLPIPGRLQQQLAALNRASAVATPPATAGVPTLDPDDTTATEGDAVAAALAATSASVLLADALYSLECAEAALRRAMGTLSRVGVYDPARPNVDRIFVNITRVKNGLVSIEETLQNLGVDS